MNVFYLSKLRRLSCVQKDTGDIWMYNQLVVVVVVAFSINRVAYGESKSQYPFIDWFDSRFLRHISFIEQSIRFAFGITFFVPSELNGVRRFAANERKKYENEKQIHSLV